MSKWLRVLVVVLVECVEAVARGWRSGRADVVAKKEKQMQEMFERDNSDDGGLPIDKR